MNFFRRCTRYYWDNCNYSRGFHIDIPIFSIILAFLLIYGGIRILIGGYGFAIPKNIALFNDTTIHITEPAETYNIVFGHRAGSKFFCRVLNPYIKIGIFYQ